MIATLRQQKFDGQIVLVGDEPYLPYQRPPLSKKFLAGELPAERLYFKPQSFYDDPAIELRLQTRVTALNRDKKSLEVAGGDDIAYDKLVLAFGARVRELPVPGADQVRVKISACGVCRGAFAVAAGAAGGTALGVCG